MCTGYFSFLILLLFRFQSNCNVLNSNQTKLTSVVTTDSGPIQGAIVKNVLSGKSYSAFKGVPYARPPINDLRFMPPVEPVPWTSVLNTRKHNNICAQGNCLGSEDCLYLNVYSPKIKYKNVRSTFPKLPVIVFIHGGAFVEGSGDNDVCGPDFLVDRNVVITFNYRLGVFGFVNFPGVSGNNGLRDQNMVLKWVKKNVAKFGGDPDNVTIMGQSAGAVSVDAHLISPQSRGLFHKSIALSGSLFNPWAFKTKEQATKEAFELGNRITGLAILNAADLFYLLRNAATCEITSKTLPTVEVLRNWKLPFVPSVEYPGNLSEIFIDECFVYKFFTGDFHNGPHMLGFTDLETAVVPKIANQAVAHYSSGTAAWLQNLEIQFPAGFNFLIRPALQSMSDRLFTAGIDLKQRLMVNFVQSEPVYYYYFSFDHSKHDFSRKKPLPGVGHAEDLQYIFYMPSLPSLKQPLDYLHSDSEVANANKIALTRHRVTTMISNFARYGKPGGARNFVNVIWKKSDSEGGFLDIGDDLVMHPDSRPVRRNVKWIQNLYIASYNAGKCVPRSRI